MAFDSLTAAQAYANAVERSKSGVAGGPEAVAGAPNAFADMVADAAGGVVDQLNAAESLSQQAAAGEAELVEVVTAITAAEATLGAVVAVRDQVVRAYQEILRMPI